MRISSKLMVLVLVGAALAGCKKKEEEKKEADQDNTKIQNTASTTGVGAFQKFNGANNVSDSLSNDTFHFEFDSYVLSEADKDALVAHAAYLAQNPESKIRLEGHTDQRGSREYNVGLGERRAKAVAAFLKMKGVQDTQISTVSYGAERLAVNDVTENAYKANRRSVIIYKISEQ